MATLRDIAAAVEDERTDGSSVLTFERRENHNDAKGSMFEERVLALVFLRCLRRGLVFRLSANNAEAGDFDDVALVWRQPRDPEAHTLLVQLKHKSSRRRNISRNMWLSRDANSHFGLRRYCTSIGGIGRTDRVTFVLLTNAYPGPHSLDLFRRQEAGSLPGLDLLRTGGQLYKLDPDNQQVRDAVQGNTGFTERFYLLCNQSNSSGIVHDIHAELQALLRAGGICEYICDNLCKRFREWMNEEYVYLSSDWTKWQALVDEYIRKEVTACKLVTTKLRYCSVADVRDYLENHTLAWVRPPQRGTGALSATKIHQALAHETHIMVPVRQFNVLQSQILCCWGPFCRWLVIIDEEEDDNSGILNDLIRLINTGRNLVIVSSRGNKCFHDTCRSSDVCAVSWNEFLGVSVTLNGEHYRCQLGDLVGVDDLKKLLDYEPGQLLALARLSPPLRMGQQLKPPPVYYVSRKLVNRRLVPASFFSNLDFPDVCITDDAYYELLKPEIGKHTLTTFKQLDSWVMYPRKFEWPLFVLSNSLETVRENMRKWAVFNFYVLQVSDVGWKILRFFGQTYTILDYPTEQEKEQLDVLHTASKNVIVEGKPGVGKTEMLSHLAQQLKTEYPAFWLLRVNLSEFYQVLSEYVSGVSAVVDILKQTVFNKDELGRLECALLRHNLQESPRVVCFVDGFDEVTPNYVDQCLEILPLLAPTQGKLLVTTRPAPLKLLEENRGVLAHTLQPFSESQLQYFFKEYPSTRNLTTSSLNKSLRDLLRIPLFAKMFGDISQEIADIHDIETLYEAFFRNKFLRLFKEKFGDNLYAPVNETRVQEDQRRHEQLLMPLAAADLLRNSEVPPMSTSDKNYLTKAGIVYVFADGKPTFLHRTFAEHFLAKWCFLGGRDRAKEFREAYLDRRLEFFMESFNRRAVSGRPLLRALLVGNKRDVQEALDAGGDRDQTDPFGRNALHLLAAMDERRALTLLSKLCWRVRQGTLSARDQLLGWTPVRYAAEGGHWLAVKKLLEVSADLGDLGDFRREHCDSERLQTTFGQSGYEALYRHVTRAKHPTEKGPAQYTEFAVSLIAANMPRVWLNLVAKAAWEEGHTLVCHLLLRAYCTMEEEEESIWEKTVRLLANLGIPDSLRNLVSGQPQTAPPSVFAQRNSSVCSTGRNAEGDSYLSLHHCAESGNANSLRAHVNLGADLDERDMFGCTAVHYAAGGGNAECVRVLLDAGVDVRATSCDGSTALHFAARRGHADCVRLLLERKADIDALNSDGDTPLTCALRGRSRECVTLLLKAAGLLADAEEDWAAPTESYA